MDKPMSNISFKLMALMFKVRDYLRPRLDVLQEAGIESGFCVLDYGCGSGSYTLPLSELVSTSGKIYSLDIQPLAIKAIKRIVERNGIENIETIQSDCKTGLLDNEVDVVILYDTFHDLSQPGDVLQEIHRVLKPNGSLSFSDHHMQEHDILAKITDTGLFKLSRKGKKTYRFSKVAL